jgi:hypothetical protein
MQPHLIVENMNDNIAIVKKNPTGLQILLSMEYPNVFFSKPLFDPFGDGSDLPSRGDADNKKMVGKSAKLPEVEVHNSGRLYLKGL